MTGGRLPPDPDATTILNAGNATLYRRSLTQIRIFEYVLATVGLPLKRPVVELKTAQDGRLSTPNVSDWPSGSDATGWKE
jgi:hypothetical protein